MPERTISVTCRDCGTVFEHVTRSNRPKLLCADCLKESQRKAARESNQRKRAGNKKVPAHLGCRDCGKPWDKPHHRPSSCTECRRTANIEYQRKLRAANPTPPRVFTCATCNAEIVRVGKSGTATYCEGCKPAIKRRHQQVADANRREKRGTTSATHCHYCNAEFDEPRQRGRHPARCFACQRQRHYAYMRARVTGRIANAKCLDCGKPVNPKRKGPRKRCKGCRKLWQLERWRESAGKYNHIRRARMLGVGSEKFTRREIFDRDGWRCGICGRKIRKAIKYPHPLSVALDHKIPFGADADATHSRLNAQPAHKVCNERKNKRIIPVQLLLFA